MVLELASLTCEGVWWFSCISVLQLLFLSPTVLIGGSFLRAVGCSLLIVLDVVQDASFGLDLVV
jgi:hypothetical protein